MAAVAVGLSLALTSFGLHGRAAAQTQTASKSKKKLIVAGVAAAAGGIAAAVLLTGKDESSSPGGAGGSVSYDGTWNGTTSQGRPISFVVSGRAIISVTAQYALSGTCTGPLPVGSTSNYTPALAITGNSFSTNGFSGTFSSSSAASGSYSTSIGTGCSVNVTWTASK